MDQQNRRNMYQCVLLPPAGSESELTHPLILNFQCKGATAANLLQEYYCWSLSFYIPGSSKS